ncbi:MAG: hypothetical protein AAF471_03485 [Myxococcota bacterium]
MTHGHRRGTATWGVIIGLATAVLSCTPSKTVPSFPLSSKPSPADSQDKTGNPINPVEAKGLGKTKGALPPLPERTVVNPLGDDAAGAAKRIGSLNKAAGSPAFGLIDGFYQLPAGAGGGAVVARQDVATDLVTVRQRFLRLGKSQPYAVEPLSTRYAQAISAALEQLLDAGVRFRQVSTADAVAVMRAERDHLKQRRKKKQGAKRADGQEEWVTEALAWGRVLPAGVDVLLSLQQGQGETGAIYVGRAIRSSDGALLALLHQPALTPRTLGVLVLRLVERSLRRYSPSRPPATGVCPCMNG